MSAALHHYHITDLKMEYSICHHSELCIIQSSPINLFLAVRISLIWYFRRSYWTSYVDIQWHVRNLTGKGQTCSWLVKRLTTTRVRKVRCHFLLLVPNRSGDSYPQNCVFKKIISTAIHRITSKLLRIMTEKNLNRFCESHCVTQPQDPAARVGL